MKVSVTVKPGSKVEKVEQLENGDFVVRVNAPPIEGQANRRVIELLAEHFRVPKTHIELVSGGKSKKKVFKIP